MMKGVVLLFVWGMAFAEEKSCKPDTVQLCANIKNALNAINSGAQKVGNGTDVEEVKKTVDGPQEASNINGNYTLLLLALDKDPVDVAGQKCLKETAEQSAKIADYIDTIAPQLQNDKDKVLDVQRNLRSVSDLYKQFETPITNIAYRLRIQRESKQICDNINANFTKIDSGATRIANGEDVNKVKAEVDGPQLASNIKNDYIRLLVVSQIITNKDINECLAKTSVRAEQQVKQISGILDKLTEDKDKVNAVFKDFNEINQLQSERIRCQPKEQTVLNKLFGLFGVKLG